LLPTGCLWQYYVAHEDILNEKTSFNSFPVKAKKECRGKSENLWAVYSWRRTLPIHFVKMYHKRYTQAYILWTAFLINFFPLVAVYLLFHTVYIKIHNTIIYIITCILIQSSFCALNFILPACRLYFATVAPNHIKGSTGLVYAIMEIQTSWIVHCPWQD
jgi:hypothetical protein